MANFDTLFPILRDYACLSPPATIRFPESISHTRIQNFLVDKILHNDHYKSYPPSLQYQRTFWKRVVSILESPSSMDEDDEFEISSDIYDHYLGLLNPGAPSGPAPALGTAPLTKSFITYYWELPVGDIQSTTLLESRNTIESGTTGLKTWTASFVLAQYLIDHPDLVVGRDVLELGAGIGFAGIVASSIQVLRHTTGSKHGKIWLTDVEDTVLATCRDNINLPCNISSTHAEVKTQKLDWFGSLDTSLRPGIERLLQEEVNAQLVIGADIVFDPSLIPPLLATIGIALKAKAATFALFALTVRNEATLANFLSSAQDAGFTVDEIDNDADSVSFLPNLNLGSNLHDVKLFRFSLSK